MKQYINYHKHTCYSNIVVQDCVVSPADYINRIKELGGDVYFTTEHGTGGDIFECDTLCKDEGVHCKFAMEAYVVNDADEKDKGNYHIMLIAKTNKARRKLNLLMSKAHMQGFYYKPRMSVSDILTLNRDDVYLTTACLGGILKDEQSFENIFKPLAKKFHNNLFLEVQAHWDNDQIALNERCLKLAKEYGLELIAGCDSHYVYPHQAKERLTYLKGKKINYPEESNFVLDYPDYDTLFDRFQKQGVLNDIQIEKALSNTLILGECEDIEIPLNIKMPSIYKDKTADEKLDILYDIIMVKFQQVIKEDSLTEEEIPLYKKMIEDEFQVIRDTKEINTSDYFLFNEKMVDMAVNKYKGILTKTGRGSCGSFYINRVLGMTQIDRLKADVPLYPDRFMSTARLLENHSLPDIDYNVVSDEPFVKASKDLLGEQGVYPMIAYGTMQEKEALQNICRTKNLEPSKYVQVSKNIDKYRNDKKWQDIINETIPYVNVITNSSIHPCAYLLLDGDIREEVGIVRSKDNYCALITSSEADKYKYLKNDYLKVTVWDLIAQTFKSIQKPIMSISELNNHIDDKVWDVYSKGLTCTLNQVDGDWATSLLMRYKPKKVSEMANFVACIRPSFNSWRENFIQREDYTTGVKPLDDVLASSNHFILFQENLMQFFCWLGLTPAEAIGIIKKISKKKIKQKDFESLENRLKEQWVKNIGDDKGFKESWDMVQSCISYGFGSAHGLCVAYDSLYGAYLKVNFPLEYYTNAFNIYLDNQEKTGRLTEELRCFGIKISSVKFRKSAGEYSYNKESNTIYKGVGSVKQLNSEVAIQLLSFKDKEYEYFSDLLADIKSSTTLRSNQLDVLVELDFFSEFGNIPTLKKIIEITQLLKYGESKKISKEKITEYDILQFASGINKDGSSSKDYSFKDGNSLDCIHFIESQIKNINLQDWSIQEKMQAQQEYLGGVNLVTNKEEDRRKLMLLDVIPLKAKNSGNIWAYALHTRSLGSGKVSRLTLKEKIYKAAPVKKGDIILVKTIDKINGYWYLYDYEKC